MEKNVFSSQIFKNYFVFTTAKNILNILVARLGLIRENLMEHQEKILKI